MRLGGCGRRVRGEPARAAGEEHLPAGAGLRLHAPADLHVEAPSLEDVFLSLTGHVMAE